MSQMNGNTSVLITGLGRSRLRSLTAVLQRDGYEILEARDGFEALQTAVSRVVDVLIAGDEMPGLTGGELIGIVRKHRAIAHCLLISGPDQPFEPEQLLIKIRQGFPAPF
jgi:CheY-like chemotaxis protein